MVTRESSTGHWDEHDFRIVFLQHYPLIIAILVRLLGDRSRAEEVANDAFWRLYRQPALQTDFRNGGSNVGGWVYRTATNLGIDALRAADRRRQHEATAGRQDNDRTTSGPLDFLLREERRGRVRAVLASIKPAQAQLLILRTSGFSYKELAEALDVKMTGIGTMLNRAEAEFRNQYLALYPHEEGL
ncbi:MAG TPA: sigma-70 family RNA polymerase sigma factor [Terriglobales bacterium]|jgi:RNA polymerase sigma factor (sigma-70 family)|nr:sigma-70 family RNA polymerase sigma factor [Terriglobales bacterium]